MKLLLPLLAALLPSLASASPTLAGDHPPVSELTRVDYSALSGSSRTGYFERLSSTSWVELNGDGSHRFAVGGSDEHSLYLNKTDGAKVQLDLWSGKIKLNGRDLYRITGMSGAVTGYNVSRVDYAGSDPSKAGVFKRHDSSRWLEHNQDGTHSFTVERAEAQALHLRKSDGARIELNLASKQIKLNGGALYRITVARTNPGATNGSQPAPVVRTPTPAPAPTAVAVPATAPVTTKAATKTAGKGKKNGKKKGKGKKGKDRKASKTPKTPAPTYATDASQLRGEYYVVSTQDGGSSRLRNASLNYNDDKRKRANISTSRPMKWNFQPVRNKPGVYKILSAKPGPTLGQFLCWGKDDSKLLAKVERETKVEWSLEAVTGKPGHFRILNARSDKRRDWFGQGLMWEMHKGAPRVVIRKGAPPTEWLVTTKLP